MNAATLNQRLRERGFNADLVDPPGLDEPTLPWPIRALLGALGWVAALFLVGAVVAIGGAFASAGALGLIGIGFLVASWFLFRDPRGGEFLPQFAFALSLAGQLLIGYALIDRLNGIDRFDEFRAPLAIIAGIQFVLALLSPHRGHATLCAAFASINALVAINLPAYEFWESATLAARPLWLAALEFALMVGLVELALRPRFRFSSVGRLLGGLLVGLLCLRLHDAMGLLSGIFSGATIARVVLSPIGIVLGWLWLCARLGSTLALPQRLTLGGLALLIALLAWNMPGLLLCLSAAALAYHLRMSALLAIAALAAMGVVGAEYWLLDWTLTHKALSLIGLGAVFLLSHAVLRR
jgi:hypothetical protein